MRSQQSWSKEGTVRYCQSKEASLQGYGHIMRKQRNCLEKEITQGTMPGARRRGRPRTAWIDNIKIWTGLPVEESIRMTQGRDKWTRYVHGVANPRIEDGKEHIRTDRKRRINAAGNAIASVRLSVCFHSVFGTGRPLTLNFCM